MFSPYENVPQVSYLLAQAINPQDDEIHHDKPSQGSSGYTKL